MVQNIDPRIAAVLYRMAVRLREEWESGERSDSIGLLQLTDIMHEIAEKFEKV